MVGRLRRSQRAAGSSVRPAASWSAVRTFVSRRRAAPGTGAPGRSTARPAPRTGRSGTARRWPRGRRAAWHRIDPDLDLLPWVAGQGQVVPPQDPGRSRAAICRPHRHGLAGSTRPHRFVDDVRERPPGPDDARAERLVHSRISAPREQLRAQSPGLGDRGRPHRQQPLHRVLRDPCPPDLQVLARGIAPFRSTASFAVHQMRDLAPATVTRDPAILRGRARPGPPAPPGRLTPVAHRTTIVRCPRTRATPAAEGRTRGSTA